MLISFESVIWSFVKRGGKFVAHALAHLQHVEVGQRVWDSEFPVSVISGVRVDLMN